MKILQLKGFPIFFKENILIGEIREGCKVVTECMDLLQQKQIHSASVKIGSKDL